MTEVFVEQPLASPGLLKTTLYYIITKRVSTGVTKLVTVLVTTGVTRGNHTQVPVQVNTRIPI